jgi:hypothetical protein
LGGRTALVHSLILMADQVSGKAYFGLITITNADIVLHAAQCCAAGVQLDISRLVHVGLLN